MFTIETLISKTRKYLPALDTGRILRAYEFSKKASDIDHPLAVADILVDFRSDEDTLVAALLHDVSEDLEEVEHEFGRTVRELVAGTEKLSKVRSPNDESQAENLQKMFLAMARDFRVVLIKLCDRLHDIRTLQHVPKEKQPGIAKETLEIYAPIASRLGIYRLKIALEDGAFVFTDPQAHAEIEAELKSSGKFREEYIKQAKEILRATLASEGLQSEIDGRTKSTYSIFRKMKRKNKTSVSEIFDLFAMRIILPDIFKYGKEFTGHLYTALGVIHNHFTPLAHRFKDYVAIPKINGYRSLHTTVMGLGPKTHTQPTEIQIRTEAMHDEAEYGVAAHWLYEATKGASTLIPKSAFTNQETLPQTPVVKKHLDWLKGLSKLREEAGSKEEFFENLKLDIFTDRIFVFTPRGDVKDLPKGATPVDFAYAVHSEIGNRCHQAKVNGNIVPLNYELKNGEVVEIITRQHASPHQNWLSFVKTRQAVNRIQSWFRNQDREKNLKAGRELVNQYLLKLGKPPLSPDLGILKVIGGKKRSKQTREDLLVEVGKGALLPGVLLRKVFSFEELLLGISQIKKKPSQFAAKAGKKIILVAGHPNMPIRFANCCNPTETDEISGFVTRGKGVTVHKGNCKVFKKTDKERWQEVKWVEVLGEKRYRVKITADVETRIGLLHDLGEAVAALGMNIEDIVTTRHEDGKQRINIKLTVRSYEELEKLLQTIEMIPNVSRAYLGV